MKLSIASEDLQAALAAACAVAKSPDPIQILCERIGEDLAETGPDPEPRPAEAGQIRIIAFNDSMVSEWRRPAEVVMTGSIAIHPEGIDRLIRASRNAEATFTLETVETDNDRSLRIATSRSAHEFPAVAEAVFETVVPGHSSGTRASLQNLATAIETARVACASRGDVAGARIALSGIHLRSTGEDSAYLDVVGTDGKRLAMTRLHRHDLGAVALDTEAGDAGTGITIPAEAVALITGMLSGASARIERIENNLVVETDHGSVAVRLIDSPYPDYGPLLDMPTREAIALAKADLEIALNRSSAALAKDKRMVTVKLARDATGIHLSSAAAGQSSSECVSETPGRETQIGFDARYMINALSVFGKVDVNIHFADNQTPIKILADAQPETTMLVMPCRTN